MIQTTAYDLAQRFIGIKEINGPIANPQILSMLKLDDEWPEDDSVPWCSAFVNYICWLLRLPRSKSLRARSWLNVGIPVSLEKAKSGYDVVIIKQNINDPGPNVIEYKGHVGFFSYCSLSKLYILGGNQSNTVKLSSYNINKILGIRRLYDHLDLDKPPF